MDSEEMFKISRALFAPDDEEVDMNDDIVDALAGSVIDDKIVDSLEEKGSVFNDEVRNPLDDSDDENNNDTDEKKAELESTLVNDLLVPRTQKQYNVQLNKFSAFCGHEWDNAVDTPKNVFTDFKIAGFIKELATKSEYVPHAKKAAVASLNFMVKKYGLPALNSYDHHVHWPLVYKALEVLLILL